MQSVSEEDATDATSIQRRRRCSLGFSCNSSPGTTVPASIRSEAEMLKLLFHLIFGAELGPAIDPIGG
jgi:hypothetical protein